MITIQKFKCAILILGILLFDLSHLYLYRLLIFLSVKYTIHNDTGLLLVIFLHQFDRLVRYRAKINITVGFISLIFLLLIILFSCFNFLQHKNIEQKYLVIISSYRVRALNHRSIRRTKLLLLVRLVYSWKLTGTLVTKFYLVR